MWPDDQKHIGGDFDDFLRDDHLLRDTEASPYRMGRSRPTLDRLLDSTNRQ